ncbi:MAG: DNA-binding response regulator [Puniceicoccaceae bacterium]|nr:MAG: DNA-binding response regulator [Puniceicoccaceae bacterium]
MTRVAIVEDQTAVREMLVEILRGHPRFEIVGESGDGHEAERMVEDTRPDLLILDARLPGLNGTELLRRVLRHQPGLRVIVFSGFENPVLIREMLQAGAHGFIEKTAGLKELIRGLETIADGGTYFGPVASQWIRTVVANPDNPTDSPDFLTAREREILKLIADGYSTKAIADKLSVSTKTVDNHRTNLMSKLNLHNVAAITRYAVQTGLVDPHGPVGAS